MLAGVASTEFSATSDAARYWVIIKPEWIPQSGERKAGSPLNDGFRSRSILRSEIFPKAASDIASESIANARRCA